MIGRWTPRLKGLAALAILVAWPLFLLWAWGGAPSFWSLPTGAEFRHFFTDINDYAVAQLVLRTLLRAAWILWVYLVVILLPWTVAARALERRGRPMLANELEVQPRWARALVGSLLLLVLATSHRSAEASARDRMPSTATSVVADGSAQPTPGAPATVERVVRSGDTLTSIARELLGGASKDDPRVPALVDRIFQLNRDHEVAPGAYLRNKNYIMPGWRIRVPAGAPARAGAATRVVRSGDTLTSIACDLLGGSDPRDPRVPPLVERIVELNRGHEVAPGTYLRDKDEIMTGWHLLVSHAPTAAASAGGQTASVRTVPPPPPARPAPRAPALAPQPPAQAAVPPPPAASPPAQTAAPHGAREPEEQSRAANATEPDRAQDDARDRGGIPIPDGPLVPAALGAAVLASIIRARRERLRTWKPTTAPASPEAPERPVAAATRAAGVPATFDLVGPFAEVVLESWHEATGEAALVQAAWERGDSVTFLLAASASPARAEVSDDVSGIRVRFEEESEGVVRADASGPRLPSLRRSLVAITDGLLVPVGHRAEGALHVPLVGSPLGVTGPGAGRLVETALVAAGLRARTEELRLVVVGDVPPLLDDLAALGDLELPALERVDRSDEAALRDEVEAEIVRRVRRITDRGGEDLHDYALVRGDDRMGVVLLVLDARVAGEWAPLLERGSRFGVAALVVGGPPFGSRRLVLDAVGLTAETPLIGRVTGLTPYLLPRTERGAGDEPAADLAEAEAEELPPPVAVGDAAVSSTAHAPEQAPSPAAPLPAGRSLPTPSARTRSGPRRHVPDEPFVSVFLLGDRVRVTHEGRDSESATNRAKVKELVAYLAGCPDGATAEKLCDVLWPERGDEAGDGRGNVRSNLKVCISRARRWLEAGVADPPELLPFVDGRYGLAFERVWVDTAAFEEAVREARAAEDPEPALRRALELYRGDLCGSLDRSRGKNGSGEQFLWVEREGIRWDLRKDAVWAADRLAAVLLQRGQPQPALEVMEPLLTSGALSEALECRAMECHAALRDREALHRRWIRLQNRLAEELEAEPVSETYDLYRALMGPSPATQTA